ncbi:hypothetical protein [Mesorhizobium sp. M0633]
MTRLASETGASLPTSRLLGHPTWLRGIATVGGDPAALRMWLAMAA